MNTAEVATPDALVAAVVTPPAKVPLAPLPGAVKVTTDPLPTGFPFESFTVATRGAENAVPSMALWPDPLVIVMDAGAPGLLVSRKLAGVDAPVTLAVTLYWAPAVVLAVKTAEVATPDELVVAVVTPRAKVPLGPLPGAAKVTTDPLPTGLPFDLSRSPREARRRRVPTVAVWGVPLVVTIEAGVPAVLVNRKFAGVPRLRRSPPRCTALQRSCSL